MKKITTILLFIFILLSFSFATDLQYRICKENFTGALFDKYSEKQYPYNLQQFEIINYNNKGKTICKDNIRFLNDTNIELIFDVFGINNSLQLKYITTIKVKEKDTQQEKCDPDLSNFGLIYIVCRNANVDFSKVTKQHSDMYLYVNNAKEINHTDYDIIQQVFNFNHSNSSKQIIYNAIQQGCVDMFVKSSFVIEYKDKEEGIVSGKYRLKWLEKEYLITFTFETKEKKYRATFKNFDERLYALVYLDFISSNEAILNYLTNDEW